MPDLRDLLTDPRRVGELTPAEAAAALVELAGLQAAVAVKLGSAPGELPRENPDNDRLLTAEDVAGRLGRSVDWVYRQSKHWPFTRRLTRRTVRFSEAGLTRWLGLRSRRDRPSTTEYLVTETPRQQSIHPGHGRTR